MILIIKSNYQYSFFRYDSTKYHGEVISDSWIQSNNKKDRLMWDEDFHSADIWLGSDIYDELIENVLEQLYGYRIEIAESLGNVTTDYVLTLGDSIIKETDFNKLNSLLKVT